MEFFVLDVNASAERVAAKLNLGADRALNNEEPMWNIVEDLFKVEAAIFSSQGRRGGGSWKRLSPDYAKRKGNTKILKGTTDETLFRSLTEQDAPFQILHVDNTGIEFGTDRPFAAVHQEGSRTNPRRPFIRFTQFDINRWNQILATHLMVPFHE